MKGHKKANFKKSDRKVNHSITDYSIQLKVQDL